MKKQYKKSNIRSVGRVGECSVSNSHSQTMKIIDYKTSNEITVMFEDGTIVYNISYSNFKNGKVNNPFAPSCHGIGYMGVGNYTKSDYEHFYSHWSHMLERCYKNNNQNKESYLNCKVCDEWHNFQNFAKWCDENYYTVDDEKMQVDKDILKKGNKIYSPENCMLVPRTINNLFMLRKTCRGNLPLGVDWDKERSKYRSQLNDTLNKKQVALGRFDTPEEAFLAYKTYKEKVIKQVADNYKGKIPQKLYDAMYNYEVEITD